MEKFRQTEIKPFEFNDLKGTHVVSGDKFKPFAFEELSGQATRTQKISDENIRAERSFEKKNNFKIDEIVRDYRGLSKQEQSDLEKKINDEVEKRVQSAYLNAIEEGKREGIEMGKEMAYQDFSPKLETHINDLAEVITSVQGQTSALIENNRTQIQEFVKRFSKWVILKEIDEKVYLEKLLEKLILEMNARKNFVIKVGKDNFKAMPEIIASLEAKLGQLSNIRVEIIPEITQPGIILETENGLIDGSMEGIFASIDKIFDQVLGHE